MFIADNNYIHWRIQIRTIQVYYVIDTVVEFCRCDTFSNLPPSYTYNDALFIMVTIHFYDLYSLVWILIDDYHFNFLDNTVINLMWGNVRYRYDRLTSVIFKSLRPHWPYMILLLLWQTRAVVRSKRLNLRNLLKTISRRVVLV